MSSNIFDEELQQPPSMRSINGTLDTVLTLELATHSFRHGETGETFEITAPLLNGSFPAPTFYLLPGDTLKISFRNQLNVGNQEYRHNEISGLDQSNLHFHGLYISGEAPSDDATLHIGPQETYDYVIEIPQNHLPGTHWLHPHRHGSVTFQVGGGAAGAVIVQDDPDDLPSYLANARQEILLVQELGDRELKDVNQMAMNAGLLDYNPSSLLTTQLLLVNGQHQPVVKGVESNQWIRFRIINTNVERDHKGLNLRLDTKRNCEMLLVAKDGIYLPQVPREISAARIVPGGRADLLVRCDRDNTTTTDSKFPLLVDSYNGRNTPLVYMEMTTTSSDETNTPQDVALESWRPDFPDYLQDLQSASVSEGCSCTTSLGDKQSVNGRKFDPNFVLHTSYLGAVVERTVKAERHPYHQHVYPFQLVQLNTDGRRDNTDSADDPEGYMQVGDWQDTFAGNALIRYQPQTFETKVMLHCHILKHEDLGMMAIEQVVKNDNDRLCTCGSVIRSNSDWPAWVIAVTVVLGALALFGSISFIVVKQRRRQRKEEGELPDVDETSP